MKKKDLKCVHKVISQRNNECFMNVRSQARMQTGSLLKRRLKPLKTTNLKSWSFIRPIYLSVLSWIHLEIRNCNNSILICRTDVSLEVWVLHFWKHKKTAPITFIQLQSLDMYCGQTEAYLCTSLLLFLSVLIDCLPHLCHQIISSAIGKNE